MKKSKRIIAVVGTGRSGTHMVGHLIDTSKNVTSSIEDKELFPLVTEAATHVANNASLQKIREVLESRLDNCMTDFYLEKSHPLMWHASNPIISELPITFIGIIRDPFAVVASMMKHSGTRSWSENWDKLPLPNAFLGVTEDGASEYGNMDIVERCTMRWVNHTRELKRLKYFLPEDKYLLIQYEDLVRSPKKTISNIEKIIGVRGIDKNFVFELKSLEKWQTVLDARQVRLIARTIERHSPELAKEAL